MLGFFYLPLCHKALAALEVLVSYLLLQKDILEDEHFQFKSLPRHKALLVAFLLKIIPRQAESKRRALAETA